MGASPLSEHGTHVLLRPGLSVLIIGIRCGRQGVVAFHASGVVFAVRCVLYGYIHEPTNMCFLGLRTGLLSLPARFISVVELDTFVCICCGRCYTVRVYAHISTLACSKAVLYYCGLVSLVASCFYLQLFKMVRNPGLCHVLKPCNRLYISVCTRTAHAYGTTAQ